MTLLKYIFIALLLTAAPASAQIAQTEADTQNQAPANVETAPAAPQEERITPTLPGEELRPDRQNPANSGIVIPYEPAPPIDMSAHYSPEHCEFTVGFPSEPFTQKRCDGGENSDECYEQISYTQTFGMDATVGFRVICNKIDTDIKDRYDQGVMVATLKEMTKKSVVSTYNTTFHEDKEKRYKLAGLVGEGKVGVSPSMFIAQMWIGKRSALTIEAELIGEAFAESDALFRDVLRSVRYKESSQNQGSVKKNSEE